jgi:FdhD protein
MTDADREPRNLATATVNLWRWSADESAKPDTDSLAGEEPLEIRVRGKSVAVTMRTPGNDAELAVGFLLSEGVIRSKSDILEIAPCQQGEAADRGNILNVFLSSSVEFDFEKLTRHVFASSSCGLCGKASIESVHQHFAPVESEIRLNPDTICGLPDKLRARQDTFSQTGGLHAAALFDIEGTLLSAHEDIGRHNAVDKVLGTQFLAGACMSGAILMVSGRSSFEIMQKALSARIPIIAAVSAPSSLAVEFAEESRQTLIGFLRGDSFNVYSHPERVTAG